MQPLKIFPCVPYTPTLVVLEQNFQEAAERKFVVGSVGRYSFFRPMD